MEIIPILLLYAVLGVVIGKLSLFCIPKTEHKSDYIQIDEKNWIVKGEFVSFEEDTPILRFQQEQEDNEHYRKFERERLKEDSNMMWDNYMKTVEGIEKYSHMLKPVTEDNLLEYEDKYQEYIFKCKKLDVLTILTKEEFVTMNENPIWCRTFKFRNPLSYAHIYTIHNDKTAKYAGGDMYKMMEAEFKEKWY